MDPDQSRGSQANHELQAAVTLRALLLALCPAAFAQGHNRLVAPIDNHKLVTAQGAAGAPHRDARGWYGAPTERPRPGLPIQTNCGTVRGARAASRGPAESLVAPLPCMAHSARVRRSVRAQPGTISHECPTGSNRRLSTLTPFREAAPGSRSAPLPARYVTRLKPSSTASMLTAGRASRNVARRSGYFRPLKGIAIR